tara:strand:+ start:1886 stop:2620 length:735 start_codon:yes stop_codon:yes gene_type:complete
MNQSKKNKMLKSKALNPKKTSTPTTQIKLKNTSNPKKTSKLKKQYNTITYINIKPTRESHKYGKLSFKDCPEFTPNLTPKEILQMGSFGGTYFRPLYSTITHKNYENVHTEFPNNWYKNLDITKYLTSNVCYPKINTYKVSAGSSLKAWEDSNWIRAQDPYGWFQWYCRFYVGRRSPDDERQISRWLNYASEKRGRFRRNLITKCIKQNKTYDDISVSPVIRQGLQQWGYILTLSDFNLSKKNM